MDSSKKDDKDRCDQATDEKKEPSKEASYDSEVDEWDEWYDDNEFQNKKSKIRRSRKRLYRQRDEW